MKRYKVQKSGPLRGSVSIPGDKSIGHRAIIFGALSRGECSVTGLSGGLDNVATANCFRAMGVDIELGDRSARIRGVGLRGLQMPKTVLDCGNSGTSMRLLAGLLAAQRFGSRMVGDHSLTRRPMGRVIEPLRARGAHIAGTSGAKPGALYPPISIAPLVEGEFISGIEYDMPIASAQVKSCMLLAGLYANGPTTIREPVLSRDHTERMMMALGVPLETAGSMCRLDPQEEGWTRGWDPFTWEVPGDPSSATFMLAAAQMVPGSQVCTTGVGVNPTRTGFFDVLRFMGVAPHFESQGDGAGGEPVANLTATHGAARATTVGGELLVRMIDEVPALAVLAATVKGKTEIRDAEELRVKESDRIAVMAKALRDFGCPCEELPDGMIIEGGGPLRAARVESQGDHRIAMSAALLGLVAEGETIVDDVECVETSFPGFPELLRSLGANIEVEVVS
ncbi:MAG: 3-phosphoshikimate 1-carboxyvinyltransferase [Myxococcales bacterium]|nr:3-phosphoshikimate 1-carboxyvinyltransferase [Myxococcales bacterium]